MKNQNKKNLVITNYLNFPVYFGFFEQNFRKSSQCFLIKIFYFVIRIY